MIDQTIVVGKTSDSDIKATVRMLEAFREDGPEEFHDIYGGCFNPNDKEHCYVAMQILMRSLDSSRTRQDVLAGEMPNHVRYDTASSNIYPFAGGICLGVDQVRDAIRLGPAQTRRLYEILRDVFIRSDPDSMEVDAEAELAKFTRIFEDHGGLARKWSTLFNKAFFAYVRDFAGRRAEREAVAATKEVAGG